MISWAHVFRGKCQIFVILPMELSYAILKAGMDNANWRTNNVDK